MRLGPLLALVLLACATACKTTQSAGSYSSTPAGGSVDGANREESQAKKVQNAFSSFHM